MAHPLPTLSSPLSPSFIINIPMNSITSMSPNITNYNSKMDKYLPASPTSLAKLHLPSNNILIFMGHSKLFQLYSPYFCVAACVLLWLWEYGWGPGISSKLKPYMCSRKLSNRIIKTRKLKIIELMIKLPRILHLPL